MEFWKNLDKKDKRNILITLGIILLVLFLYFFGKNQGSGDSESEAKIKELEEKLRLSSKIKVPLPNSGSGIPSGWSPTPTAIILHDAMLGIGTYVYMIWDALEPLTDDQLAAVLNAFNDKYYDDYDTGLYGWFAGDLSAGDLRRAMSYFNNVNI